MLHDAAQIGVPESDVEVKDGERLAGCGASRLQGRRRIRRDQDRVHYRQYERRDRVAPAPEREERRRQRERGGEVVRREVAEELQEPVEGREQRAQRRRGGQDEESRKA